VLVGEPQKDIRVTISNVGTGLYHDLNDWNRDPVAYAGARLLDDRPGGLMSRSANLPPGTPSGC
jgi:hypothetical protein